MCGPAGSGSSAGSGPDGGSGTSPLRAVLRDPAARLLTVLVGAEYALLGMLDILLVVLAFDLLEMSSPPAPAC